MEDFNEKVFEAVAAGIICLDSELRITHHNRLGACAVGAAEGENLAGKLFFKVASDNLFGLRIAFQKTLEDKKKRTFWGHPVPKFESNEKTFWDFTVNNLDSGIVLSAVEVTDRVEAERSLQDAIEQTRQSSNKLRSVVGQMTDGVIVCNSTGKITKINRAAIRIFGEDSDELIIDSDVSEIDAEKIKNLDGSAYPKRDYPWNLACAKGEATIDKEILVRRAEDDEAIISVNSAPLFDNDEKIVGSVTVLRDVTENRNLISELKTANRQLEEYNRLKAEFVANMSHELRTPLTAIIGFAQLMQMKYERGESVKNIIGDGLERILRNGRHLLTLIDEVLDLSKIEAGRLTLHLDHFDLPELIENTFASLESLALEKKLGYKIEVSGEFAFAFSDSARIKQIMMNLLSNAIKFTPEGTISVKLQPHSESEWRLIVTDTGMGIESQNVDKIFERFRQVDGSYTRKVGGFGLGLSISQHLAELLGGKISVASEPGKGSTFTLTLPYVAPKAIRTLAPVENGYDAMPDIAEKLENDKERHSVLVIDDIPDSTQILSQMLQNAGYNVAVAHSGAEGIRIAKKIKPDAITLDVMMPGMDGWRVLQALKADPQLAKIPVVVVSIVDNKPLGYRLGASDYLVKPVEPNNLLETLNGVIPSSEEENGDYVLVVDDEQGVRELLIAALKQGGFKTRSAASGEIAFSLSQKHRPKAVLTDLHMPNGMSGYELIARLRSQNETAHTPILIITGKDLMEEDRRLINGQIADVIRKGDLMLTDLEVRLRETLAEIGVIPTNGNSNAG